MRKFNESIRPSAQQRVGFYCWGGPGTIRMTKVKYFNPRIDEASMMSCYDYDYLARAQELFGITDVWATYSWGFSDRTEEEDHRFLLDRLDNFKRLGMRVHAYVQGPNLVSAEFPDKDHWWARDERGRTITYYRGRLLCSIHQPDYVDYVVKKIQKTYGLGFDGIYIDNIQHGQLGVPTRAGELPFVFTGDRSEAAQAAFRADTGLEIPTDFEADPALTQEYLNFRVRANTCFITTLSEATRAGGMAFGTNYYDPKFDPTYIYAIDISAKSAVQDYVLFENHALPLDNGKRHNQYIQELIEDYPIEKPVFVVSYREGVGMSPQFDQNDLDNLFSEAHGANFMLCLKGGEFTTKGVWHCLYLDDLQPPRRDKVLPRLPVETESQLINILTGLRPARYILKRYYNPLFRVAFEWPICRFMLNVVYDTTLK